MSGILQPHSGSSPGALVSWSCRHYDETHSLSGFGLVVETWSIDAEGNIAKSRTDGLVRNSN